MSDIAANEMAAGEARNPDLKWYVVHAYSGMEKAVERNIVERINRAGMQSKFGRIMVPTEEVVEIKSGVKRTTERKFFPGYVLVEHIDATQKSQADEARTDRSVSEVIHREIFRQVEELRSRQ